MGEVLYVTNTPGGSTALAATDTSLLSGNIKAHLNKNVKISSSVQITTTGTSLTNNISFKIKLGSTVLATIIHKPQALVDVKTINLEWMGDTAAGGAVSITQSASSADAQTTMIARNLYVVAEE
jgi:hypothetical protein